MVRAKNGETIAQCLEGLYVENDTLTACGTLVEEWSAIKKAWFTMAKEVHPDKGGAAADFRAAQSAFETLRKLYEGGTVKTFAGEAARSRSTKVEFARAAQDVGSMPVPSWEWYMDFETEIIPIYRVELAKSDRSKCKATGAAKHCDDTAINKGAIRIGWWNRQSGDYGNWVHLACWRVPNQVHDQLPDPDKGADVHAFRGALARQNEVQLSGFRELPEDAKNDFVEHAMLKDNWAAKRAFKKNTGGNWMKDNTPTAGTGAAGAGANQLSSTDSKAVVPTAAALGPARFVVPKPGVDGPHGSLAGQTVVLTGIFPEVGGGSGLKLGKENTQAMVESFGGKVTSSISGKTTILLVGRDPGFSKVSKARDHPTCTMYELEDLAACLRSGKLIPPANVEIQGFSLGYKRKTGFNSLALSASEEAMRIAQYGHAAVPQIAPAVVVAMDEPKVEVDVERVKDGFKAAAKATPKAAKVTSKPKAKAAPKPKAEPKAKAVKRKVKVEDAVAGVPAKKAKVGAVVKARAMATTATSTRATRSSTRLQMRG